MIRYNYAGFIPTKIFIAFDLELDPDSFSDRPHRYRTYPENFKLDFNDDEIKVTQAPLTKDSRHFSVSKESKGQGESKPKSPTRNSHKVSDKNSKI